jgi:hypothetical protein
MYIELTPPAAIACAVIPVCRPFVTASFIVVVSPGKYTDCDVDDDGILITP